MESWTINEHTLEYFDDNHIYLVDGVILPSITTMLKVRFGGKYANIDNATLQRAADAGTALHSAIERYCKTGEDDGSEELSNFKFLQKQYGFEVLENEVPVILFDDSTPIAAGRLNMVIMMNDRIGGADIKRTSTLDKEYLAYQLNLYRIAYRQSYGVEWQFLRGIWLRAEKRKLVQIPINEQAAWDLVVEYMEANR